jgi:hypothetical protein
MHAWIHAESNRAERGAFNEQCERANMTRSQHPGDKRGKQVHHAIIHVWQRCNPCKNQTGSMPQL